MAVGTGAPRDENMGRQTAEATLHNVQFISIFVPTTVVQGSPKSGVYRGWPRGALIGDPGFTPSEALLGLRYE